LSAVHELVMQELRAGRGVSLTVTGHSMTPAIRSGDRLTLEPLRRTPRLGDVLACDSEGRLVVHRLVAWERCRAVVRGDVAPACDPPLAAGAALGLVTRIERGGREVRCGPGSGRALAWLSWCGALRVAACLRERLRPRTSGGILGGSSEACG
jgi:hypothetical protein